MHRLLQDTGFRYHFLAYVLVNALLIVINLLHPDPIWFFWPLLGWGIGLFAHGYAVSRRQSLPLTRPGPPRR